MSDLITIPVKTDFPYTVTVGSGILKCLGNLLSSSIAPCRAAIITDSNVAPLYLDTVVQSLSSAGIQASTHVFPAGEQNKNIETWSGMLEFLAESGLTRRDCVFALGGGVTGDMAGFAAGCYLRGIRFIQLPTTLLSAVDSSVGGKTGVDLKAGKNLAGLFVQPSAVVCDTDCLKTLSDELFSDGLAEAIKTGILFDPELFEMCRNARATANITSIIAKCVEHKAQIVLEDEFEKGPRKLLNLGHTPAHAIEKCSGYSISHGSAVAIGTVMMARASEKLGIARPGLCAEITEMFRSNSLPVSTDIDPAKLAAAALYDKKRLGSRITVVFPEDIGKCVMENFPVSGLEDLFRAGSEV
ncbi:MAG: 3-dehydroquinate synthase [Clostridia bacterium]|nr:3-dehydroquinate synthase [Clostridia bacterium]